MVVRKLVSKGREKVRQQLAEKQGINGTLVP